MQWGFYYCSIVRDRIAKAAEGSSHTWQDICFGPSCLLPLMVLICVKMCKMFLLPRYWDSVACNYTKSLSGLWSFQYESYKLSYLFHILACNPGKKYPTRQMWTLQTSLWTNLCTVVLLLHILAYHRLNRERH